MISIGPLNKRGRETAKTMAAYLRRAKITPDLVLCSTAVRAKQTLEPIVKAIKRLPPAEGKFPTGAVAAFRFDGAWKELRSNGATVLSFTSPKEIASRLRPHSA